MKPFSLLLVLTAVALAGVGCTNSPKVQKEFRPPEPPPPVPAVRKEPLNQPLREFARRQIDEASNSTSPLLRGQAIEAIQNTMVPGAADLISAALKDKDPQVRFAAVMAAGKLQLSGLHDQIWEMADDPNLRIQIGSRCTLHRLGDKRLSHDFERMYYNDPNPRVREDAAAALGLLQEPSALNILRRMTRDSDAAVRIQVADSMWRLGDEQAVDVLVAGLVSQFVDDQMLCLMGLVGPRDRRVENYVQGKLTGPYVQVGLVAARCMGELGFDTGYGLAMNSLRSPDPRERVLAAIALGYIGRSDCQTNLAPLLKDSEPPVRLAAAQALLMLKEPQS